MVKCVCIVGQAQDLKIKDAQLIGYCIVIIDYWQLVYRCFYTQLLYKHADGRQNSVEGISGYEHFASGSPLSVHLPLRRRLLFRHARKQMI